MCSTEYNYCPGAACRPDPYLALYGSWIEAIAEVDSGDAK
jgi:hypothetical protein